jgi:hypothetical protein
MSAVATRPRVAKAKPAPVTSPLADILARIGTSQHAIGVALSATDEGSDLWTMLFGIDDNLMPYSLESLYRTPVSKEDVGEAYEKLLFTLTVLKAALMMSKGLVMEAKLQEAFEILDHAHNDMDGALAQDWPIPDGAEEADGTADAVEEDDPRLAIAREAVYEVDALLHVLRSVRHDENNFKDAFNGMSLRALDLTGVAMSALANDTGRTTDEMQLVVRGDDE